MVCGDVKEFSLVSIATLHALGIKCCSKISGIPQNGAITFTLNEN